MRVWKSRSPQGWSLASKFMVLSAAVVVVTIAAFATLDYFHERQLLGSVHALLSGGSSAGEAARLRHDHEAFVAQSKQGMEELFAMHFVHLAVTLVILLIALNVAFHRIVVQPVRRLVAATNVMARGTWDQEVRPQSQDELGQLTAAFNALGEILARRVADWRNAERLSALAELSNWATREVSTVENELAAAVREVANEQQPSNWCQSIDHDRLCAQVARLKQIRERLDSEFHGTFHEIRLASVNAEAPPKTAEIEEIESIMSKRNAGDSHDHDGAVTVRVERTD